MQPPVAPPGFINVEITLDALPKEIRVHVDEILSKMMQFNEQILAICHFIVKGRNGIQYCLLPMHNMNPKVHRTVINDTLNKLESPSMGLEVMAVVFASEHWRKSTSTKEEAEAIQKFMDDGGRLNEKDGVDETFLVFIETRDIVCFGLSAPVLKDGPTRYGPFQPMTIRYQDDPSWRRYYNSQHGKTNNVS